MKEIEEYIMQGLKLVFAIIMIYLLYEILEVLKNLTQKGGKMKQITKKDLDNTVKAIDAPLERIYQIRPSWRPKRDLPFNEDIVDDECEREREEFEVNL